MSIASQLAAELKAEATMTRNLLARIPADKFDWKPADDLHTVGWNAGHLAEIVGWVRGVVHEGEFDLAPVNGPKYTTPVATSVDQVLSAFDQNLADSVAALEGVPDVRFDETWSMKMGGQTLFTMNKHACLRKWVFTHTAHHRGILMTYLRLAGVKVTSIYEG